MNQNNPEFLDGINARDEKALNALCTKIFKNLYYSANFLIKDADEATDIAIKAFLKLRKHKQQFNDLEHVHNYLFKIIQRACIDYFRKLQTKKHKPFIIYDEYLLNPDEAIRKEAIDNKLIQSEDINAIYEVVNKDLSDEERTSFRLFFEEDLKTSELADRLGIKKQSVRNRKSRLIEKIREILNQKRDLFSTLILYTLQSIKLKFYLFLRFFKKSVFFRSWANTFPRFIIRKTNH